MRISIVEYGVGNIQSVVNVCEKLGYQSDIARNGYDVLHQKANRIILPGVGAVGHALQALQSRGLIEALTNTVVYGETPFLGICVGMQVLASTCNEFGVHQGLDWIPGEVSRIAPLGSGVVVPHIGWNTLNVTNSDDPVIGDLDGQDFYFVHSQVMRCDNRYVLAKTDYHGEFVSAVRKNNIFGLQFHPEKSSVLGERLIAAFIENCDAEA